MGISRRVLEQCIDDVLSGGLPRGRTFAVGGHQDRQRGCVRIGEAFELEVRCLVRGQRGLHRLALAIGWLRLRR